MTTIVEFLSDLGRMAFANYWLPLLVWTVIAVPIWLLVQRLGRSRPDLQYGALRALLLALPLSFLLLAFGSNVLPEPVTFSSPFETTVPSESMMPSVSEGIASLEEPVAVQTASSPTWPTLVGMLTLIAFLYSFFQLVMLLRQYISLWRYRGTLFPLESHEAEYLLNTWRVEHAMKRSISLRKGEPDEVPMTFGWLRPVIVLPPSLLNRAEDLRLVLHHEFIHILRHDFFWSHLEHIVRVCFVLHPGISFLQRRIEHFREITCDARVLSDAPHDRPTYAQLLLQFIPSASPEKTVALPMVKHTSTLKERITAMKSLKNTPNTPVLRTTRMLLFLSLLFLPAFLAACSVNYSSETSETELVGELSEVIEVGKSPKIQRLKIEMDYLTRELDALKMELESMKNLGHRLYEQREARYHLLNAMYMQRLESYETLKMRAETDRKLQEMNSLVAVEEISTANTGIADKAKAERMQKEKLEALYARERAIEMSQIVNHEIRALREELIHHKLQLAQLQVQRELNGKSEEADRFIKSLQKKIAAFTAQIEELNRRNVDLKMEGAASR